MGEVELAKKLLTNVTSDNWLNTSAARFLVATRLLSSHSHSVALTTIDKRGTI